MGKMKRRIIPIHKNAGRLEAKKWTKHLGDLPSNVLLDDYLARSESWREIMDFFPLWAREILVYPEEGGRFKSGKDVVDSKWDRKLRKWILPASYIPDEAIGREKVGLFIDPEDITEEDGKVVVHPGSIVVLHPFIQKMRWGKVDERTRIPLEVEAGVRVNPDDVEVEARYLCRTRGVGVRPLLRGGLYHHGDNRRRINAIEGPNFSYGVAVEVPEKELEVNVSVDELEKLLKNADASLIELSLLALPEQLEAIRRLLDALEIRE